MSRPVVGIDLSLTATGIATDDGKLATIKTDPSGTSIDARLTRLYTIIELIEAHLDGVNIRRALVVIEGPSLGQARQSGEHLRAGLWWLLMDRFSYADDVVEVPPATLKRFATGKGSATKPDMRMAIYQRTGLDVRDDNQVDAYWLRQAGLHLLGDPDAVSLPKTNLAALDKLDWNGAK